MSKARILIVTPKSPSTNPRMRKAADALAHEGYTVKVLWAYGTAWADAIDQEICAQAKWESQQIGGNPVSSKLTYFFSRLFRKMHEKLGNFEKSKCRSSRRYISEGINWKPGLVIGHNPGALGPASKIAENLNIPSLFDAEDYHRGESFVVRENQEVATAQLENQYIPRFTQLTSAAPLISEAYEGHYPQHKVVTVNNAFSKQLQPPAPDLMTGPLKIIWFSQVVGLDRGLKEFLQGLRLISDVPIELNLLGLCSEEKNAQLTAAINSSVHSLQFHEPRSEKELLQFIGQHEIGLALEHPTPKNRDICRTNKLFTYPLAGCYMLLSHTASQEQFLKEWPATGALIDLNTPATIARQLKWCFENREELLARRMASWKLASETLNWEVESKQLTQLVQKVLAP